MLLVEASPNIIGVGSLIAALITAAATLGANIIERIKAYRSNSLKVSKMKDEIESFMEWYKMAKPALEQLRDRSSAAITTEETLKQYKKSTTEFSGGFRFWQKNKVELLSILEKRKNKEISEQCKELMNNIVFFDRLLGNVKALMNDKGDMNFNEFCDHFIDLCPEECVKEYGGENANFNSCLGKKMERLEKSYDKVYKDLKLPPLTGE